MAAAKPTGTFPLRPSGTGRGADVARALSVRFAERGWRCFVRLGRSASGSEEITIVDQGAVSPDHRNPKFVVDSRAVDEQVEEVLEDLERRGWAGPPPARAALWCEPA